MILKSTQGYNENCREYLNISMDNTILKIKHIKVLNTGDKREITKEIDVSKYFKAINTYGVFLDSEDNGISDPHKIRISRDLNELYKIAYDLDKLLCSIFFNTTQEEFMIIARIPLENADEVIDSHDIFNIVAREFPLFEKHKNRRNKKMQILSYLDCNESLSGLEPQVDYLTMIIKDIISDNEDIKNKLIKKYPNIENFFSVCGSQNILNIKPEEEMFEEIRKQKEFIRQKQTEYYELVSEV